MKKLYKFSVFILLLLGHTFISGDITEANKTIVQKKYILGRIGFMQSFSSEVNIPVSAVTLGVESYGNVFYKLCSSDGETVVRGGMLNQGVNGIDVPLDLITGSNKGVFIIYLKEGDNISKRQIVLIPNRYETIETDPGMDEDGSVSDMYRHEITVNGEDNRFNDYASRIMMDSVTGDYPGLNQGVPILPILYLFISKILRSVKKKKRGPVSLYSETELFIMHKKDKNKLILLNLRILTSEM